MKKSKHLKTKNKTKTSKGVMLFLLIIVFIASIICLVWYLKEQNKNKEENINILDTIQIDESEVTETKTKRMLQVEELQKQNNEIVGWLEIADTNINYPIVQGKDNDFYLRHNYKKEYSVSGSLFLDKDFDMVNKSSNYLIYGHRDTQGLMFEDLMKYANKEFYESHKKIRFTTNEEDCEYEVLAVFYSRVYYKSEKNVFRYYFFVNANNEAEYDDFVNNAKKASIYDTGVTAKYGDQLMTLSTCEYSQEDGRFAVVLKKVNK